jgi:hypothetical protein
MSATTRAWIEAAPRIAHMMEHHNGYPSATTAEHVIWMALLMVNGKLPFMNDDQVKTGTLLIDRYYTVATTTGLIESNPELYNPLLIEWTDELESKAFTGFLALNRHFDGPLMEH